MSQINLLPDYYIKQRFRKRVDLVFVIVFALMIFSIIAADKYSSEDFERITKEDSRVRGQFDEAARTTDEIFNKSIEKMQLQGKAKASISLLQLIPRSYLLAVIANDCPSTVSIVSVDISDKEIDPQAGKLRRVTIVNSAEPPKPKEKVTFIDIMGTCALDDDASKYVSKLKANPVFKEVSLRYTQEYKGSRKKAKKGSGGKDVDKDLFKPAREFYVKMKVDRTADIPELVRKFKVAKSAASETKPADVEKKERKEAGK